MTGLVFVPYTTNRILTFGFTEVARSRDGWQHADPPWAARLVKAHKNAVENLVVFAPLALAVAVTGAGSAATALACYTYFWARVVHAVGYAAGFTPVRGLSFVVGVVCQVTLALRLLGLV